MIVRNDNSKLVKRDGLQLTSEAGNLANRNTFKYSGIANVRTVDMSIDAEGKVSLGLAAAKNLNKPASSVRPRRRVPPPPRRRGLLIARAARRRRSPLFRCARRR
jgi:hypothetical protein